MERTIKDVMTRVQGLLGRVERQSTSHRDRVARQRHIALDGHQLRQAGATTT